MKHMRTLQIVLEATYGGGERGDLRITQVNHSCCDAQDASMVKHGGLDSSDHEEDEPGIPHTLSGAEQALAVHEFVDRIESLAKKKEGIS